MIELKEGKRVRIYQDPLTEKDFEGVAILIKEMEFDDLNSLSSWIVHFVKDGNDEFYRRWIKMN